jgi:hypothetical protein
MLGFDVRMVAADRCALRVSEGLLKLGGEFVEAHGSPVLKVAIHMRWGARSRISILRAGILQRF